MLAEPSCSISRWITSFPTEALLFLSAAFWFLTLREDTSPQFDLSANLFQVLSELVAFLLQELQTFFEHSQHRRLEGYL